MQKSVRRSPLRRFIRSILAIAAKDLRAELRNRQLISAMGLFGILTVMVFVYSLQSRRDLHSAVLPSVLWVTVIFAGTTGIGRNLSQEHDRGTLDGLLLAPIDRAALFYGKFLVAWLFTLIVAVVVSIALNFLFNTDLLRAGWWLIIFLGTLGFASISTLLGSMAVYVRGRETTLPIIVLPVALPIVIASVNGCTAVLQNFPISDWIAWPALLTGINVIFLGLSLVLFDFIVEE